MDAGRSQTRDVVRTAYDVYANLVQTVQDVIDVLLCGSPVFHSKTERCGFSDDVIPYHEQSWGGLKDS